MKNDKIKIFNMRTAIVVTIVVVTVGVVSAALVLSYSTTVGTVKVNPVLIVEPSTYILTVGDNDIHNLRIPLAVINNASIGISAYINTSVTFPDGTVINGTGKLGKDGIRTTEIYLFDTNNNPLTPPVTFPPGDSTIIMRLQTHKLDPGDYVITIKANPVP